MAAYRFILAAVFFVGLAHIALLPPFEGFDETAHWSSIAQWGHGGGMPVYGTAGIDRAIREYPGPLPYTAPGGVHYDNFDPKFSVGPHESRPPEFFEGEGHNWQAQHPPLYYLLLRPVFRMFNSFSWADQFFALRAMSWLFAFAGFAIGVEASKALFAESGNKAAAVMASWPFLVPQFFPEMARIGNDSLCLLFFGVAWQALLRIEAGSARRDWAIALGLALGAGLWTKAFFVPLTAGTAAWFAWSFWRERDDGILKAGSIGIGLAVLLGAGWYFYKFVAYGNPIGGDEMLRFDKEGGVFVNFLANVALIELLRGYATIFGTFIYAGNWSLARTSPFWLAGPAILLIWVGINWLMSLNKDEKIRLLPVFLILPMVGGLSYHQMLRIAIDGEGSGTPGWYLHILAPALAAMAAWGWPRHRSVYLLVVYGGLFAAYSWVMQLALFSGCSVKRPNEGLVMFNPVKDCVIDMENLAALSFPVVGIAMLVVAAGLICLPIFCGREKSTR